MLIAVVDTSTPAVTAALVELERRGAERNGIELRRDERPGAEWRGDDRPGVTLVAQRRTVDARAHGELLAPAINAILDGAGARPGDLAAIVAGLGPGPFTGLRVGLVTAAAMAQALSIPAYGVCSLDGIGALTSGSCLVATDARRKEVYWAVYQQGARVSEPAVNRPGDIAAILDRAGVVPIAAAGDGAHRYADVLALPILDDPQYPSPVALAESAAHAVLAKASAGPLVPLYLRGPDAVEPGTRKPVNR